MSLTPASLILENAALRTQVDEMRDELKLVTQERDEKILDLEALEIAYARLEHRLAIARGEGDRQ